MMPSPTWPNCCSRRFPVHFGGCQYDGCHRMSLRREALRGTSEARLWRWRMLEAFEGYWPYIVALASGVIGIHRGYSRCHDQGRPPRRHRLGRRHSSVALHRCGALSPLAGSTGSVRVSIATKRFRAESRPPQERQARRRKTNRTPPPCRPSRRFESTEGSLRTGFSPFPLTGGKPGSSRWWGDARLSGKCLRPFRGPGGKRSGAVRSYIFDNDALGRQFRRGAGDAHTCAGSRCGCWSMQVGGAIVPRPSILGPCAMAGWRSNFFLGGHARLRGCPMPICRNHASHVVERRDRFTGA